MSNLDRLMPEDVKGYDHGRDDYRADQADIANDERAVAKPAPVTLAGLRKTVTTAHHPAILESTVEQAYLLGRIHALQGVSDQSRDVL